MSYLAHLPIWEVLIVFAVAWWLLPKVLGFLVHLILFIALAGGLYWFIYIR